MSKPRILVYDLETSPFEVYTFGLFDQTIGPKQIRKFPTILSWAAKWVGEKRIFQRDTRREKDPRNDKKIVTELRDLLNEADYVLTQNGKKFDNGIVRTRCSVHRITPPAPYTDIDTKVIAKSSLNLHSSSLEYMTKLFGLERQKSDHARFPGQELWNGVLSGNAQAWEEMKKYNIQDILATEELYEKILRPFDKTFNFTFDMQTHKLVCACGSDRVQSRGTSKRKAGEFTRYQCQGCGTWRRDRFNIVPLSERKKEKIA